MDFWPRIAETLLTPPSIVIVLLILTLLAYFRKHWLGTGMLVLSIIVLVALSLPSTG